MAPMPHRVMYQIMCQPRKGYGSAALSAPKRKVKTRELLSLPERAKTDREVRQHLRTLPTQQVCIIDDFGTMAKMGPLYFHSSRGRADF